MERCPSRWGACMVESAKVFEHNRHKGLGGPAPGAAMKPYLIYLGL